MEWRKGDRRGGWSGGNVIKRGEKGGGDEEKKRTRDGWE